MPGVSGYNDQFWDKCHISDDVCHVLVVIYISLVISWEWSSLVVASPVECDPCLSSWKGTSFGDQPALQFLINIEQSDWIRTKITYRKYRCILKTVLRIYGLHFAWVNMGNWLMNWQKLVSKASKITLITMLSVVRN